MSDSDKLRLLELKRKRAIAEMEMANSGNTPDTTQEPQTQQPVAQPEQKQTYFNDISNIGGQTAQNVANITNEPFYSGTIPHTLGAIAQGGNEILNAGVYNPISQGIKYVTPEFVKGGIESTKQGAFNVVKTGIDSWLKNNLGVENTEQAANIIEQWKEQNPEKAKYLSDVANVGTLLTNVSGLKMVPDFVNFASKLSPVKAVGKFGEEQAIKQIARDSKIKDATANMAGYDTQAGVEKITNDISKYNLQSTWKGTEGIAENAQKRIDIKSNIADEKIKEYSRNNPDKKIDVDKTFLQYMDDAESGRIPTIFTTEDAASEFSNSIHKALSKRGLTGEQPISKIPEIKQTIKKGLDLFSKGKFKIDDVALKEEVGDHVYLRFKKELENEIPELKNINNEIHDLIVVKQATREAAKREGNKYVFGLPEMVLLTGAGAGAYGFGPSGAAMGAIPGAAFVARKALGSNRGASGLMSISKGIQKGHKAINAATLAGLAGNLYDNKQENK